MNAPGSLNGPRPPGRRMGVRLLLLALAAVVVIYLLVQITEHQGGRHVQSTQPRGGPPAGSQQQRP